MEIEFKSKAEKYKFSRDQFRRIAQYKFLEYNKDAELFIASINELVASLSLFLSGKTLRDIEQGLYLGDLVVSFCRSHFIALELTLGGELVEAAIIIRKQMELLSRLNEITSGLDIDRLVKRTPNLKHLKTNLKKLYSDYSEVAHSASPKVMQLLGRKEYEAGVFTTLYPEFQENSYVIMQHLAISALEFYVWCSNFYQDNFSEYDSEYDSKLFETAISQCEKIFTDAPVSEINI